MKPNFVTSVSKLLGREIFDKWAFSAEYFFNNRRFETVFGQHRNRQRKK